MSINECEVCDDVGAKPRHFGVKYAWLCDNCFHNVAGVMNSRKSQHKRFNVDATIKRLKGELK